MPNEVKYKPQIWGEPIEDERLSTNGHYTGEQVGGVTQDAKCAMEAHMVEESIIRLGTMTQDVLNDIQQGSGSGQMITFTVAGNMGSVYGTWEVPEGTTWRQFIATHNSVYIMPDSGTGCGICGSPEFYFEECIESPGVAAIQCVTDCTGGNNFMITDESDREARLDDTIINDLRYILPSN